MASKLYTQMAVKAGTEVWYVDQTDWRTVYCKHCKCRYSYPKATVRKGKVVSVVIEFFARKRARIAYRFVREKQRRRGHRFRRASQIQQEYVFLAKKFADAKAKQMNRRFEKEGHR